MQETLGRNPFETPLSYPRMFVRSMADSLSPPAHGTPNTNVRSRPWIASPDRASARTECPRLID